MKKLSRISAIGASLVLLGALAAPASASADGSAVVLKGHITTYGGKPITGVVVEVVARVGGGVFTKGVRTTSTGRYAISVKPDTVYAIRFVGKSSDDHVIDPEFVSKSGHVRVGSTDLRLNKSLHHVD